MAFQIKQHWQPNKIIVNPLALSATGFFINMLNQSLTTPNVPPRLRAQVQEVVTINICSIIWKFVSDEVHLPEEEPDNP